MTKLQFPSPYGVWIATQEAIDEYTEWLVSVPLRGMDCYLNGCCQSPLVQLRFRPLMGYGLLLQPSFRIKYYRRKVNGIN